MRSYVISIYERTTERERERTTMYEREVNPFSMSPNGDPSSDIDRIVQQSCLSAVIVSLSIILARMFPISFEKKKHIFSCQCIC